MTIILTWNYRGLTVISRTTDDSAVFDITIQRCRWFRDITVERPAFLCAAAALLIIRP